MEVREQCPRCMAALMTLARAPPEPVSCHSRGMSTRERLRAWRRRRREERIRARAAYRAARERVDQADRDVDRAGLKRPTGGFTGGV